MNEAQLYQVILAPHVSEKASIVADKHRQYVFKVRDDASKPAIKQAVEAGLGLGIVSIHTLELDLEAGRLVTLDVKDFPILRHWYIVHRQGKRLSPVAQAFKEFVLQEGASLLPYGLERPHRASG